MPANIDEEKRNKFKVEIRRARANKNNEIWYQDECGIRMEGNTYSMWARKGTRPEKKFTGTHFKVDVLGAVRENDGKFFSLMMPEINNITFQIFIDKLQTMSRKQIILILDNARWHRSPKINWGKIKPLFLPPYSPDLNPIERIWLKIKTTYFRNQQLFSRNKFTERVEAVLKEFSRYRGLIPSLIGIKK